MDLINLKEFLIPENLISYLLGNYIAVSLSSKVENEGDDSKINY